MIPRNSVAAAPAHSWLKPEPEPVAVPAEPSQAAIPKDPRLSHRGLGSGPPVLIPFMEGGLGTG